MYILFFEARFAFTLLHFERDELLLKFIEPCILSIAFLLKSINFRFAFCNGCEEFAVRLLTREELLHDLLAFSHSSCRLYGLECSLHHAEFLHFQFHFILEHLTHELVHQQQLSPFFLKYNFNCNSRNYYRDCFLFCKMNSLPKKKKKKKYLCTSYGSLSCMA